jgi:hypothetical protein
MCLRLRQRATGSIPGLTGPLPPSPLPLTLASVIQFASRGERTLRKKGSLAATGDRQCLSIHSVTIGGLRKICRD